MSFTLFIVEIQIKESDIMKQPEVSIVVPVFNVEKYLERCVNSILSQTFKEFEVILVDDGSTDYSGMLCDQYSNRDSRVRVIHKTNGGLSDARNVGIDAALGKWILFVDSDDFIEPEMVSTLHTLAVNEKAQIAICGIRNCYEGMSSIQYPKIEQFSCTGTEALRMTLEGGKIPGSICDKLIQRELVVGKYFPRGKIYEDAFYMPELLLSAEKVVVTTQPLYNYWHRRGSITTHPFTPKKMDVIKAYEYTMEVVRRRCPELVPFAEFRLLWAHLVVLDSIILVKKYRRCIPQYAEVICYLKANWKKVFKCHMFTVERRFAALLLKLNVNLYKALLLGDCWRKKELD